jgi:predicted secreted protein
LAGADVSNVAVTCVTDTFTIGGNVSGLAGSGLVLQNNTGDNLAIDADGSFTFATQMDDGSAYAVTVLTQPTSLSQTCGVANGSGTLAGADVSNVAVTCITDTFTVGGNVSGLAGSGLVLQNNDGDDLPIAADGSFTFATALVDGSGYAVTVLTQPTNLSQTCSITNGSGTIAGADISNVTVTCASEIVFADGFEG